MNSSAEVNGVMALDGRVAAISLDRPRPDVREAQHFLGARRLDSKRARRGPSGESSLGHDPSRNSGRCFAYGKRVFNSPRRLER